MKEHYKTLGLEEGASQAEIQAAYDRLSKDLDPTKHNNEEFFVEEFKKVQEAYEALSNSSILGENALKVSTSNKTPESGSESSNTEDSTSNKSSGKISNQLITKVNILYFLVAISLGLNGFLFYRLEGKETFADRSKKYAEDAEKFSKQSKRYADNAEESARDARGSAFEAELHSDNAESILNYFDR